MKKSLFDIQLKIRELDGKIKELSSAVAGIYEDINELRNHEADGIDYKMIQAMSRQLPFKGHPLRRLEDGYAALP